MTTPAFVRTADEVSREATRLRRFLLAYEKLADLIPNDGPLGHEAVGAMAVIDWLFNDSEPALSEALEDVLRYGWEEIRTQRRRG